MSRLLIRVIPNAPHSEIVGQEGETWKIRLAAPPVDGKANIALIRFLADTLDCAQSELRLVKGHTSKIKIIETSMHAEDVRRLLGGI